MDTRHFLLVRMDKQLAWAIDSLGEPSPRIQVIQSQLREVQQTVQTLKETLRRHDTIDQELRNKHV